jgi:hypothetical protein
MGKIKYKIIALTLFAIISVFCKKGIKPDRHHTQFFRKSGMAFTNLNKEDSNKLRLNGRYRLKNEKYPDADYFLTFTTNGLNYRSSQREYSDNKHYWGWHLYKILNDTILSLHRDYHTTMGGKLFYLSLYKILNRDSIVCIEFELIINESLSLNENIEWILNNKKKSSPINYYVFENTTDIPPYTNCKWLSKSYFWASDSLYQKYKLSNK